MNQLTNRQNEIVKASIKLISEGGIQNFTLKTLAAELSVSEPAIYRHFSSKMEIILSMLSKIEETNIQFKKNIDEMSPSLGLLEHMFLNNAKLFTDYPELSSIIFSEEIFQNNKILSDKVLKIMKDRNDLTTKVILDIQKKGEIRNDITAQQLTTIIIGSLRLTISKWKLSKFSFDLSLELMEIWSALSLILKK